MKHKIKLSLLAIAIGSVVMLSCQKKSATPQQKETSSASVMASTGNTGTIRGPRPRMYYNGDGWCHSGMEVNCVKLPEIVVTSSRVTALLDAANGTSTDVAAVFNDPDFEDINAEFPDDYLAELQSGNFYISVSQ